MTFDYSNLVNDGDLGGWNSADDVNLLPKD